MITLNLTLVFVLDTVNDDVYILDVLIAAYSHVDHQQHEREMQKCVVVFSGYYASHYGHYVHTCTDEPHDSLSLCALALTFEGFD